MQHPNNSDCKKYKTKKRLVKHVTAANRQNGGAAVIYNFLLIIL